MASNRNIRAGFLFLAGLLFASLSQGQPLFKKVFGGTGDEAPTSVIRTHDGGYLVGGSTGTLDPGNSIPFLLKVDSAANKQWWRPFKWKGTQRVTDLIQLPDSTLLMLGSTNGHGNGGYDLFLQKLRKNGDSLWMKTYGGEDWDLSGKLDTLPGGGTILCGSTFSYGAGHSDVYMIKTGSNGDTVWTRTLGTEREERGEVVARMPGGGFAITGKQEDTSGNHTQVYLATTDASGNPSWEKNIGGSLDDQGKGLIIARDSGLVVIGDAEQSDTGTGKMIIMKTDPQGNAVFNRKYGPDGENNKGYSVSRTPGGGLFLAGGTNAFGGGRKDMWIFHVTDGAVFKWSETYGGSDNEHIDDLFPMPSDSGFVAVGPTTSFGLGKRKNILLVKADKEGNANGNVAVGLNETGSSGRSSSLRIHPNPCRRTSRIPLPEPIRRKNGEEIRVSLHDPLGRVVLQKTRSYAGKAPPFFRLPCSKLKPGFYTVRLRHEGQTYGGKLLVK